MCNISKNDISSQENRFFSQCPSLITEEKKINSDFGINFEEYFNDRFGLRKNLINMYSYVLFLISNRNENGYYDKKTLTTYPDWCFRHCDIKIIKENFKFLYEFNDFCEKNNIKLYTLIVPNKADIYTTKFNYYRDEYIHKEFLDYIKDIQKENKIKIIYPYNEMKKEAKNDNLLYFKTDHHWTDDGAYIAYLALMNYIKKDFPKINVLNRDNFDYFYSNMIRSNFNRDFNYGGDCLHMGFSESVCKIFHKYNYRYYRHKKYDELQQEIINDNFNNKKLYYYKPGANYRVIQMGTSQNENLTEFIPFTFKEVKRIKNSNVYGIPPTDDFKIIKYFEKDILNFKPDIIIFCITFQNIQFLNYIFNLV